MRPRPSTIVRAAVVTAAITTGLLAIVALQPRSFQTNLGAAAALLLLVPGGLSGYVVRPREPHVATQMLLGLRFLAVACGLWAFLAAATLVAGRTCMEQTGMGTVCEYWPGTGYVIAGWAACAFLTAITLAITLRNTTHPPEQGEVPRFPGRLIAVVVGLVLGATNGVTDLLADLDRAGPPRRRACSHRPCARASSSPPTHRFMTGDHRDLSLRQKRVAWTVGLIAGAASIANAVVDLIQNVVS
jgi:hypothetical protein